MPREQDQFLDVIGRDEAERRWWEVIAPAPLAAEPVPLEDALGRVLAEDVLSDVDVPSFDRSNVDGYAVRAEDTFGASEEQCRWLALLDWEIATGVVPERTLAPNSAAAIATGAMLPRGADAVVMVEHAEIGPNASRLAVRRPVGPGANVTFAGTDIARGELVLRRRTRLSARETGVLAAIGRGTVEVVRTPRVAILSTGDELIPPGATSRPGAVFDANSTLIADAVRELGCAPIRLGIVADDEPSLEAGLARGSDADLILLSGGTSKGSGDVSYRALRGKRPGIVVHGVALKPGKPICLGAIGTTPVAILPGFPTSAIFTFHEFVAPVLRRLAGLPDEDRSTIDATLPLRHNSEVGRTEYALVSLVDGPGGLAAYPMGKGSGSVTTFSGADGFIIIPRQQEYIDAGERVAVVPLGRGLRVADLNAIGSHCVGLDWLLGELHGAGFTVKTRWVGSQGGLLAVARGECDLAGIHLLDTATDTYNAPFLPRGARLIPGYGRMQGVVHRPDDPRFEGRTLKEALGRILEDADARMVNRNRGSGTRVLIDRLLGEARPAGYAVEARSHGAVAASVAQGRADWGVAIETVASMYGLGFLPLRAERYDFAVPESRWERPAVAAFQAMLARDEIRARLATLGFAVGPEKGGAGS